MYQSLSAQRDEKNQTDRLAESQKKTNARIKNLPIFSRGFSKIIFSFLFVSQLSIRRNLHLQISPVFCIFAPDFRNDIRHFSVVQNMKKEKNQKKKYKMLLLIGGTYKTIM